MVGNLKNNIKPQRLWENLDTHYINLIEDKWYKILINIQHQISISTTFFYEQKVIKTLHLPITTSSISSPMGLGSDSLPVQVDLCNVKTYLADSMQFMLEYGCRLVKEGCYYIMPSFRGEQADERHLCQFFHSEAEIPGNLDDVIKLIEEYVRFLSKDILDKYSDDLYSINNGNEHITNVINNKNGFDRITLDEAISILDKHSDGSVEYYKTHKAGFRYFTNLGEQKLISLFNNIVWVTHYDRLAVPFYQAFSKNDPSKAINADLLFGIGETVGAGQRHTDEDDLDKAMELHQVHKEDYEWYYNMKKKYPMKTSGFGLGIERFMLWLFKHNDIRDCQILPRFNGINIIP